MSARHILANWQQKWKGIERRNGFWSCARLTYEVELKSKLDKLSKLGHKICEDLVNYNPEKWSKAMVRTSSKCDSVDNNMAESFNAWVLGPRHKTIISILEEIRIKVMNRFTRVRAFADTWNEAISPMAMMVLVTNVEKSMRCTIHWNGDFGYEVKGATGIKHIVKLTEEVCSCRAWQLKRIPCAHGVAAIHHKRLNPLDFISEWYNKETSLKVYSHFIQSVPCMEMWPESTNAKVEPSPVRTMPGRPTKKKKKEGWGDKNSGKLTERGISMSCSICKSTAYNRRRCPNKPQSTSEGVAQSQKSTSKKKSKADSQASTSKKNAKAKGGKGRSNNNLVQKSQNSDVQQSQVSDVQHSQVSDVQQSQASKRDALNAFKRPRIVGHGVFVSKSGYTCVEQGRPVSRVIDNGRNNGGVESSAVVTGDLGYKPSKCLKWKGKQAIKTRQLQHRSALLQYLRTKSPKANEKTGDV